MWLLCFLCCYTGIFLSHAREEEEDEGRGKDIINTCSMYRWSQKCIIGGAKNRKFTWVYKRIATVLREILSGCCFLHCAFHLLLSLLIFSLTNLKFVQVSLIYFLLKHVGYTPETYSTTLYSVTHVLHSKDSCRGVQKIQKQKCKILPSI